MSSTYIRLCYCSETYVHAVCFFCMDTWQKSCSQWVTSLDHSWCKVTRCRQWSPGDVCSVFQYTQQDGGKSIHSRQKGLHYVIYHRVFEVLMFPVIYCFRPRLRTKRHKHGEHSLSAGQLDSLTLSHPSSWSKWEHVKTVELRKSVCFKSCLWGDTDLMRWMFFTRIWRI